MKKAFSSFIIVFSLINYCFAQSGTIDTTFNIGSGADHFIYASAIQDDGKIIIGGRFTAYNNTPINGLARLNVDGSIDTTFNIGTGITGTNGNISAIAIQPDGKIIIGGSYTFFNANSNGTIRLNTDGTEDLSFNSSGGHNGGITKIALQSNGKIIITGTFTIFGGTSNINRIVRLNTNGTIDNTFLVGGAANGTISDLVIQNDDKIIYGGDFTYFDLYPNKRIGRLNADGTRDTTFSTGFGFDDDVLTLGLQNDGKIIVGGFFTSFNLVPYNYLLRMNTDGSIDNTFNTGSGTNSGIYESILQNDGKIIISGQFSAYNGNATDKLARINTNGSHDLFFNSGSGASSIRTINIQNDNKIFLGGQFTNYNGTPANRLTRLMGDYCEASSVYIYTENSSGNYSFTNTSTGNYNQSHWAFGDGNTSTLTNPTHTFTSNGTYVAVLTINDSTTTNACTDFYIDTITVTGLPTTTNCIAGYSVYPDTINGGLTIVNSSTGSNLTYNWDFGDGNNSTLQNPSHTYGNSGPFNLCLTVDDGNGCTNTYCDSIGEGGVLFESGFDINVISFPDPTGLENEISSNSDVRIYPNPTSNKLAIQSKGFNYNNIAIKDVTGRIIKTIKSKKNTIDVNELPSGIYFINLIADDKTVVKKFVKQ